MKRIDTATEIERIKLEIEGVEAELKKERTEERRKGKKSAETSIAGLGEEEDWTVNERGEVRYLSHISHLLGFRLTYLERLPGHQ